MESIHIIINLEKGNYPKHVAKLVETLLAQKKEAKEKSRRIGQDPRSV